MLEMADFGVDPHAPEPCDAQMTGCTATSSSFSATPSTLTMFLPAPTSICGVGAAPFTSPRARSFTVVDPSGEDVRASAAQSSAPDGCDLDVVQDRRRSNPTGVHPPELPAEDRHLGVAS